MRCFARLLVLTIIATIFLPLAAGSVVVPQNLTLNYSRQVGLQWNNGTIRFLNTYTLVWPVGASEATQPSEVFLNLTGRTDLLPNKQMTFLAWNRTSTGTIPITFQTGAVSPSFVVNALNYSYANTNMTLYTQLSNQTVTVDFNTLGTSGIKIFNATTPIIAVPTYAPTARELTIRTGGAGILQLSSVEGKPIAVSLDGVSKVEGAGWQWNAASGVLTLTGGSVWIVRWTTSTTTSTATVTSSGYVTLSGTTTTRDSTITRTATSVSTEIVIVTLETRSFTTSTTTTSVQSFKPLSPPLNLNCVIATAAYASDQAPEVVYMRHVRDNLIGSTSTGRVLVEAFNGFYYSWSPWLAEAISASALLRAVFRVLLLPLIGIVHATALIFAAIGTMTGSADVASVIAFLAAASMTLVVYVALPVLGLAKLKDTIRARQISTPDT